MKGRTTVGQASGRVSRWILGLGVVAAGGVLQGCTETDAWLWDPSKIGRWERTPTTTPILSRITSIEGPGDEFVQETEPQPEDLIPEVVEYRIAPGDVLNIIVWNLPNEGDSTPYQRLVDSRGVVVLPQLGELQIAGETVEGAKAVIADRMRSRNLVADPVLDLSLQQQRELRFSVVGAVFAPGPYVIPAPDFRLLEALSAAGGASEEVAPSASYAYVIRQIPLEERVSGRVNRGTTPAPAPAPPAGENLVDIINKLAEPPKPEEKPAEPPASPGVVRSQPAGQPPIELPPAQPTETPTPAPSGDAPWVFLNGKWVQATPAAPTGQPSAAPGGPSREQLVTQRVIRIPLDRLLKGDARYNIVVRPGDIIRVPRQSVGVVFVGGEVTRVGTYTLSDRLTLSAAIIAAGGLNSIAIPERVDLTRHVGNDRLATIRLNLRAISERTHPDLYLRPNDQVNVGTSFWATPMAIIRNGFRATYGFGFLLDRNFGADVFGPEPVDRVF